MNTDFEKKYLQEGQQTKITDTVNWHLKRIGANTKIMTQETIIQEITRYVLNLPRIKGYHEGELKPKQKAENYKLKDKIFRQRTATQILQEGLYPTCSDVAIVARTLLIARNIPTAYVETFHEDFLFGRKIHTHSFLKIIGGYINPTRQTILEKEQDLFPYIIYKEALDSWDVGARGLEDLLTIAENNKQELLTRYEDQVILFNQKND